MFTFKHSGNFNRTEKALSGLLRLNITNILRSYGQQGVSELAAATPKDSGLTSQSWAYEIVQKRNNFTITWTNSNVHDGVPVAILIQYGHGTSGGTYVEGRDFINPAIKPILDKIAESIWEEVTKL